MARRGMQVVSIQLLGRWGSMGILRYIQDAPLANLPEAAKATMMNYSMAKLHQEFQQMHGKANRDKILVDRLVKSFNVQLKAATDQLARLKSLEDAPKQPSDSERPCAK